VPTIPTPVYPPTKKLHYAQAVAAGGNTTLIAANADPAKEIVIAHYFIQNASAVATTAKLLSGSFVFFQALFQTQGAYYDKTYPQGLEERLGTNGALVLNLSGSNSFNIVIGYWIDAKI
jgi:hypothetical protein